MMFYYKTNYKVEPKNEDDLGVVEDLTCLICKNKVQTGILNVARHRAQCPAPGTHILVPGSLATDKAIKNVVDYLKNNPPAP